MTKKNNLGMWSVIMVLLLSLLAGCSDKGVDGINGGQTQSLSDRERLYVGTFYFKDNEYHLPMSIDEFEAIGPFRYMYQGGDNTKIMGEIEPGVVYSDEHFYPEGEEWINNVRENYVHGSIRNRTGREIDDLREMDVVSVYVDEDYVLAENFRLPGGIKIGSSKEEVLAAYGEPDKIYEDTIHHSTTLAYQYEAEEYDSRFYYGSQVHLDDETGLVSSFGVRMGAK